MPDRDVRPLRDLIWYQCAKIIAKRALGPDAKRERYGFVKQTLRDLQSGRKQCAEGDVLDLLTFSTCRGQQSTKASQNWMPDYPFF